MSVLSVERHRHPVGTHRRPRRCLLAAAAAAVGTACGRSDQPTLAETLLNATYLSESMENGLVTLTNGEYRAGSAPGEMVTLLVDFATGDLDGDGEEDAAAVLVERGGGTGAFYRLHAVLSADGSTRDVSSRLLGDRVLFEAVRIENGVIQTDLLVHRPGEPVGGRPTVPSTSEFVLTDRGLLLADFPTPSAEPDPAVSPGDPTGALTRTMWRIVSIRAGEGPTVAADTTGDLPRLSFAEELLDADGSAGRLVGSTGCNRVLGSYRASRTGSIRISGVATTRRLCGSAVAEFEQLFNLGLGSALGFELRGDELEIRFAGGVISLMRTP